jgi:hypothetical protein
LKLKGGNMKRIAMMASVASLMACAGEPPVDNPSAPGAMRPDVDQAREARGLEQAESECAKQGKHAVSQRVEGETVYGCAE